MYNKQTYIYLISSSMYFPLLVSFLIPFMFCKIFMIMSICQYLLYIAVTGRLTPLSLSTSFQSSYNGF